MRFKKILLLLVLPLCFIACNKPALQQDNTADTAQSTLQIGAVKLYGNSNPVLEKFVQLYNKKHPASPATIKYYDNVDQLRIALSTTDRPDVVELSGADFRSDDTLFEDLYPLLDADAEYHRTDMPESVLNAFEKDRKLLSLPSSFVIRTVTGRVRQIGEETGWSLDDLVAVKEELGDEYVYFSPHFSVEDIMFLASAFLQRQYVDWEKHEGHFESEGFLRWLELCKTCTSDNSHTSLQDWDEHILLYIEEIQSFERLAQIKINYADDPFVFKGFPSGADDNGSIIGKLSMSLDLAIPVDKNKDASWLFVRECLSDQWQSDVMGLPIKTNIASAYLNGMVNKSDAIMTEQDKADFYELLDNTRYYLSADDTITRIIIEEAAAFWAGDKSASDVAKIINNRVNIFLQEKKNNS